MRLLENCLHLYAIESSEYNEDWHKIEYRLGPETVFFDKGRAFYHQGWKSHYRLIGFFRVLFNDPVRGDILRSAESDADVFVIGGGKFAAIWTGTWTPLERMGFVGTLFHPNMFQATVETIQRQKEEGRFPESNGPPSTTSCCTTPQKKHIQPEEETP